MGEQATEDAAQDEAASEPDAQEGADTEMADAAAADEGAASDQGAADEAATEDAPPKTPPPRSRDRGGQTEDAAAEEVAAEDAATGDDAGDASGFARWSPPRMPMPASGVSSVLRLPRGRAGPQHGRPVDARCRGRDIASVEGFRYSDALMGLDGAWTPDELSAWLENPREYARATGWAIPASRTSRIAPT